MKKTLRQNKYFITVVLLIVAAVSLVVGTYAWLRNFVDFDGAKVQTGRMLYNFTYYSGTTVAPDLGATQALDDATQTPVKPELKITKTGLLYSTGDQGETSPDTLVCSEVIDLPVVEEGKPCEVFFLMQKLNDSIDFDYSLKFMIDGLSDKENEKKYQYITGLQFAIDNTEFDKTEAEKYCTSSEFDLKKYYNDYSDISGENQALTYLTTQHVKSGLGESYVYSLIRIKITLPHAIPEYSGIEVPLRVSLCVAQKGALPEANTAKYHYVETEDDLRVTALNYKQNDVIVIQNNIDFIGDLVFSRPCTVMVNNSKLTVTGNMIFSYLYEGEFKLDTSKSGQVVIKKSEGVAGGLTVDTPNAVFNIVGLNIPTAGKADIYAEGNVSLSASSPLNNENEVNTDVTGVIITNSRICDFDTSIENSNQLKQLTVTGKTRLVVSDRTQVGPILADRNCTRIVLVNRGYIASVNLASLRYDSFYIDIDNIFIDNYGIFTEDTLILLPDWSYYYLDGNPQHMNPNTYIRANIGSGAMQAITYGRSLSDTPTDNSFYSDGTREEGGKRNDIVYIDRVDFVEKLDAEGKKIIVHYEQPSDKVKKDFTDNLRYQKVEGGEFIEVGSSLQSFIEYYNKYGSVSDEKRIASVGELEEVRVICYGHKVLTENDYAYIRQMASVVTLDLEAAASENDSVPDKALENLKKLVNLKMPDTDTYWGKSVFSGCSALDEIWFPRLLTDVADSTTLSGIHYVHTSSFVVNNIYVGNLNDSRYRIYYFCQNQETLDAYCALYDKIQSNEEHQSYCWDRYFFLDNGVTRHGYYFLRLNDQDSTCEFVTYGNYNKMAIDILAETTGEYKFDMSRIYVGKYYDIVRYDDHALYDLITGDQFNVTFNSKLTYIGKRAFLRWNSGNGRFNNVTFETRGEITIGNQAFRYQEKIGELRAPYVTKISGTYCFNQSGIKNVYMPLLEEINAGAAFYQCSQLVYVDMPELKRIIGGSIFSACSNLQEALMPKLVYVKGDYIFSNCLKLKYMEISIIERLIENGNVLNANFATNSQTITHNDYNGICVVRTENRLPDALSYTEAIYPALYFKTYVPQEYAHLYQYWQVNEIYYVRISGLTNIGDRVFEDLKFTNVSGQEIDINGSEYQGKRRYEIFEDVAYIFDINDDGETTATTVSCRLASIGDAKEHKDYTLISQFTDLDGKVYDVTRIGEAAYTYTAFLGMNTLTIPDSVTYIGERGLYYGKAKYMFKLNLNNVKFLDTQAVNGIDVAYIEGEQLETACWDAFANHTNLKVVVLPQLKYGKNVTDNVNMRLFLSCSNIVFAYTQISDKISFNQGSVAIWLIGGANVDKSKSNAHPNANIFVNTDTTLTWTNASYNTYYAGENWEKLLLCDWYAYNCDVQGVNYQLNLPGYAIYKKDTTSFGIEAESTLGGISREFGTTYMPVEQDYVTPNFIYATENTRDLFGIMECPEYTVKNNGKQLVCAVTTIGNYVYNKVSLNVNNVKIADSTTTIGAYTFYGSNVKIAEKLDLNQVTQINSLGVAQLGVLEINAPNLKNVAYLRGCTNLKKLYLPGLSGSLAYSNFENNTSLVEATLGENLTHLYNYPFSNCLQLKSVTLLYNKGRVAANGYFMNPNNASQVKCMEQLTVRVPASVYDLYMAYAATTTDGKIYGVPKENFVMIENTTAVGGITYYWEQVGETGARITYLEGDLSAENFAFASQFDVKDENDNVTATYNVIDIGELAMIALEGVKNITLPKYLMQWRFDSSKLPSTLKSFQIDSENAYFTTQGGILYNKDMSILIAYPQAKSEQEFVLPESVNCIAPYAFYGAKYLTKLTVKSKVDICAGAFAQATMLKVIDFDFTESEKVARFIGMDTFKSANSELKLYVDSSLLAAFKLNVWFDSDILDMFVAKESSPTTP